MLSSWLIVLKPLYFCAKANRELHRAQLTPFQAIPQEYKEVLNRIAALSSEVEKKLAPHWQKIIESFLENPCEQTLIHGDPNHFNWLVDLDKQVVTYIDFSNFSEAGFALHEFYEAMLCFWTASKRIGNIDAKKLQNIRQIYEITYRDNELPNQQALFQGYWELRIIESLLSRGKSIEKEMNQFLKI